MAESLDQVAISMRQVSKTYGDRSVLNDITLDVAAGEFFGVIGPNGAGKTTLLEIVEGIRKPSSGSVKVLGMEATSRNSRLARQIGIQTQTPAFFHMHTAREHLETMAAIYGGSRRDAANTLAELGLESVASTAAKKLSGGQQQRLAIAAALVHNPSVVFLDEPTSGLDPQARIALWDVLRSLRERGATIIYTTHFMDEAEALCDRVALIDEGSVVTCDTPSTLIDKAKLSSYLTLDPAPERLEDVRALASVSDVQEHRGRTVLAVSSVAEALRELDRLGVATSHAAVRSPSLEDVYLKLTGKEAPVE